MAIKQSQDVPFRCKNRFGRSELQIGKCEDYGSKGHPGNIVYLKPQELPPANKLPKCPCCGVDMEPVKQEARRSIPWWPYAVIGIAVLFITAVLVWFLWPSPPPPPSVEELLKEVWPSLR